MKIHQHHYSIITLHKHINNPTDSDKQLDMIDSNYEKDKNSV